MIAAREFDGSGDQQHVYHSAGEVVGEKEKVEDYQVCAMCGFPIEPDDDGITHMLLATPFQKSIFTPAHDVCVLLSIQ